MAPTSENVVSLCALLLTIYQNNIDLENEIHIGLTNIVATLKEHAEVDPVSECKMEDVRLTGSKQPRYQYQEGPMYKRLRCVDQHEWTRPELVKIWMKLKGRISNQLKVPRDAKRRRDLMYKWFDDHYSLISSSLETVLSPLSEEDDVTTND
jgi:hypothetical protein